MALLLTACSGGGGGSDSGDGDGSMGGDTDGRAVDEIGTDELRRSAARHARVGLSANLGAIGRLDDDDLLAGDGSEGALLTMLDEGSAGFMARTLGLDDPNARVTRDGNVITIDPDDARLCADDEASSFDDGLADLYRDDPDGSSGDGAFEDDGMSDCQRLVEGLTVRIDAETEDSGVLIYLFEQTPVLAITYSPQGGGYELRFEGLQRVLQRVASFDDEGGNDDDGDGVPATMRGAISLDAHVFDSDGDSDGNRESGEFTLRVTEAIELADDGVDAFSLGPSTVLALRADETTGNASLSVEWGALRLVAAGEDDGDSGAVIAPLTLALGGLSFRIDVNEGAEAIRLSDAGIGGVPLNVEIGGVRSLSLALETFGMSLDADSDALVFDTPFGIELMIDNLMGLLDELPPEYTAMFEALAPAGTRLSARENGATRVEAGGPLDVSFVESDNEGSVQSDLSIGAGACFDEDASADSGLGLVEVPCD